jgi:hypothetical protein
MSALVFMDTETTGLSLTDDIWEFAGIRREEDGTQTELHLFIEHDKFKCAALPPSFSADHMARYDADAAVSQGEAAILIGKFMGGKAHIVGAVPNFDTERIALLLNHHSGRANWHYHLIDVENLAVGFLARAGTDVSLPWDSDELSTKVGIDPPTDTRHTAMGDALWAMAVYDRVMGVTS